LSPFGLGPLAILGPIRRGMLDPTSDGEAPGLAVADDVAGGRGVEVGAEDRHGLVGVTLAKGSAGLASLLDVAVEVAGPVGLGHLDGVVHEVAGDDGVGVARAQPEADVAGR